jgi:hypothetical protein
MSEHTGRPSGRIRSADPVRVLIAAFGALLLFAGAAILLAIVRTSLPCQYQGVSFAILAGIVLATIGAVLGGSANVRGNLPNSGIKFAAGGGVAFLLIVMGAVWWATQTQCRMLPNIRLSDFPSRYAFAHDEPRKQDFHLRVRFDDNLILRQQQSRNINYDFFIKPEKEQMAIAVDMIRADHSVQVCKIVVKRPSQQDLDAGLLETLDIQLEPSQDDEDEEFVFRFRDDFGQYVLAHYNFVGKYDGKENACIEVRYYDKQKKATTWAVVTTIYLVSPTIGAHIWNVLHGDFAALRRDFKIYGIRALEQPTDATEKATDSPLDKNAPQAQLAPSDPGCSGRPREAHAVAAIDTLENQGLIAQEDIPLVYANWCNVRDAFYRQLLSSDVEPAVRYRLAHFVRTSITAIDVCWASNDDFRLHGGQTTHCKPRLDQPRDLSRALPFADTPDEKEKLFSLLRNDNASARQEIDFLLRMYPHDDFQRLFESQLLTLDSLSPEACRAVALAAVGYYYNRIVEQEWQDTVEHASKVAATELNRGLRWANKLKDFNRATSRSRLFYGRAQVYLQTSRDAATPDVENQIRDDFKEVLNLKPDEAVAHPYPYHLARGHAYLNGGLANLKRFQTASDDGFQRVPGGKPLVLDRSERIGLRSLPDDEGEPTKEVEQGAGATVLMQYGGAEFKPAAGKEAADGLIWYFVVTNSGTFGWVKSPGKTS